METAIAWINGLVCFIEAWFMYRFLIGFCTDKHPGRQRDWMIWCLGFGALVAFLNTEDSGMGSVLAMTELIVFGSIYMEESVVHSAFLAAAGAVVVTGMDMVAASVYVVITHREIPQIAADPVERCMITLVSKVLLLMTAFLIGRYRNRRQVPDFGALEFLWAGCNMLITFGLAIMMQASQKGNYFISFLLCLVMLFGLDIYIYRTLMQMQRLHQEQLLCELELQEQGMSEAHFKQSRAVYQEIREKRHDAKHHVGWLEYLLDQHRYGEMEEYLRQVHN